MAKTKKTARSKSATAAERAAEAYAARSHAAWRKQFHKDNPAEKAKPRMRMRNGVLVDVNRPWAKLNPAAKADNLAAARAAYAAVMKFPDDREAAADYVHKQWIARNKADKHQPRALFKPYASLPEVEKDKDRAHIDQMKQALGKRAKAAPAKKQAAPALAFSAQDRRKLEGARKRVAAALGRDVALEALIVASAEALASMAASLGKAKPRG